MITLFGQNIGIEMKFQDEFIGNIFINSEIEDDNFCSFIWYIRKSWDISVAVGMLPIYLAETFASNVTIIVLSLQSTRDS